MTWKAWYRWMQIANKQELDLLEFYKTHPDIRPDGSFCGNLAIRAYTAGFRAGRAALPPERSESK